MCVVTPKKIQDGLLTGCHVSRELAVFAIAIVIRGCPIRITIGVDGATTVIKSSGNTDGNSYGGCLVEHISRPRLSANQAGELPEHVFVCVY